MQAKSLIAAINGQKTAAETEIRDLSTEKGQLNEFAATYQRQRERLVKEHLLEPDDTDSRIAVERLEHQLEEQEAKLQSINEDRLAQEELERTGWLTRLASRCLLWRTTILTGASQNGMCRSGAMRPLSMERERHSVPVARLFKKLSGNVVATVPCILVTLIPPAS